MLPTTVNYCCRTGAGRVLGQLHSWVRRQSSSEKYRRMFETRWAAERVCRKFEVSDDQLVDVSRRMSDALDAGLRRPGQPSGTPATIRCWDTRVPFPPPPASAVIHRFLGVDLCRGDRFRTRLTVLQGTRGDVSVKSRTHSLTPGGVFLVNGHVGRLFDCVATGLAEFAGELGVKGAGLPVAFTFGFPVRHPAALGGPANLHRWTKGFNCTMDADQGDVAAEWRAAVDRVGVVVGTVAVFNDACVAMIDSAAEAPATRAALVLDEGCNCCYVPEFGRTIVNTEWGAFGEEGELNHLLTEYDHRLDARSRNPGKQTYEKMTSGMYMAELVRETVLAMAANKALFGGNTTAAMNIEHVLEAKHLWLVDSDPWRKYRGARIVLTDVLCVPNPSVVDCELFRYACRCITRRSAHLIAAGLSAVMGRTGLPVTVAMAGHAFETHSEYAHAIGGKTRQLTPQQKSFTLRTVDPDGQGSRLMARVLATIPADPAKQK